jgi:hypothetical protein
MTDFSSSAPAGSTNASAEVSPGLVSWMAREIILSRSADRRTKTMEEVHPAPAISIAPRRPRSPPTVGGMPA